MKISRDGIGFKVTFDVRIRPVVVRTVAEVAEAVQHYWGDDGKPAGHGMGSRWKKCPLCKRMKQEREEAERVDARRRALGR